MFSFSTLIIFWCTHQKEEKKCANLVAKMHCPQATGNKLFFFGLMLKFCFINICTCMWIWGGRMCVCLQNGWHIWCVCQDRASQFRTTMGLRMDDIFDVYARIGLPIQNNYGLENGWHIWCVCQDRASQFRTTMGLRMDNTFDVYARIGLPNSEQLWAWEWVTHLMCMPG